MAKDINNILFHLAEDRRRYFNAIVPPTMESSIFAYDTVADFQKAINSELDSYVYGRGNNPTTQILRKKLAALEEAEDALLVGSGAAAMAMAVLSCVKSGDHVICVSNPYSWTQALVENYLSRFGITHTFVAGGYLNDFKTNINKNTRLIILESPNSLTYEIQDLASIAVLAKANNITTIADNSCATPLYQNPINLGIDIVIHSLSKYLNGHSDTVAGVICSSREHIERIFYNEYMTLGPAISPGDASMILRGLRTFPLRMERIHSTAINLIEYLKPSPHFASILYPLDPDFPQFSLAAKQMTGCGGLITIKTNARSIDQMNTFANSLKVFKMAVSWGGPESLILPMSVLYGLKGRNAPRVNWNVARLSIGLEDDECLIDDLEQAASAADF